MADMSTLGDAEEMEPQSGAQMGPQVIENEDGSATLIEEGAEGGEISEHDANLAEKLPENELISLATRLLELIRIDKESRKKRDELYEEGLKRTGLGEEAPGGAQFTGASRAVHPVLAEACVDYSSSAIKEIFPPDGPVKIHNFAETVRPDEIERAENKRDFMNWQLVEQIPEFRGDLEVLLTQQPLAGSQYLKVWWDGNLKRICTEFIPADLVYMPFACTGITSTQRFSVVVPLTKYDYEDRVASGMYRDINLLSDEPFTPDESLAEKANNKIEGKTQPDYNEDGLRNFFEVYVNYGIEDEDEIAPYIVTIDEYSEKVVSIYRNWEENDPEKKSLEWVVEFPFIPWRGAGGIGLTHLIGSLAGSATGALRALLDAAHLSNLPGGIKLKGARASGQNITVSPTEITEIEAPSNVDDIRKVMMPLPFPQPSPVLFQLLGWLTEAAKGVVSTAEEKISEASNQMPVGTAMALIEQGSKVASAIHMRLHNAQQKVFAIMQRLNYKYYDPQIQIKKFGRVLVPREDFLDMGNIVPVSDPYMFSESQRFAQIQGVLQMAQDPSVPWNKVAIYKRMLRLMHVASPQEFLPEPPQPVSADPVTEIVTAMSGQPIAAQPQMNQMEHIQEELQFLLDPVFGAANPVLINPGFQVILNDIFQHMLFLFQQMKQQALQQAQQMAAQNVMQQIMQMGQMQGQEIPPEMVQQVVMQQLQSPQVASMIKQMADQQFAQSQQQLQPLVKALQQAAELVKQKVPPPVDPQAQAAMQVTQMQEQTKLQLGQMKQQMDQAALQMKAQMEAQKLELQKMIKLQIEPQLKQTQIETEISKNDADNEQHQMTELLKNHEDNLTQLEIAKVREQGETDRKSEELYQRAVVDILTSKEKDDGQGNAAAQRTGDAGTSQKR